MDCTYLELEKAIDKMTGKVYGITMMLLPWPLRWVGGHKEVLTFVFLQFSFPKFSQVHIYCSV